MAFGKPFEAIRQLSLDIVDKAVSRSAYFPLAKWSKVVALRSHT